MKVFRDYHDLYLKLDVLLLADIFESFRKLSDANYGLDPAYYYTSPGLAFDACLKMTKIKLELLQDIDMHLFVEKMLRGGISMIPNKHAIANNKYMSNYDKTKPSSYILYVDANALYSKSMLEPLPVDCFRWASVEKIIKGDDINIAIMKINTEGETGTMFMVDLDYPVELHDLHNDNPLAVEKCNVE